VHTDVIPEETTVSTTRALPRRIRTTAMLATLLFAVVACGPRFDRSELVVADGGLAQPGVAAPADGGTDGTGAGTALPTEQPTDAGLGFDFGSPTEAPSDGTAPAAGGDTAAQPQASGGAQPAAQQSQPPSGSGAAPAQQPAAAASTCGSTQAPGVTGDTIRIGYLVPETGAAPVPSNFEDAADLYWREKERTGGTNGRKVEIVVRNTDSNTQTAVNQARAFITQDRVFTVITLDRLEVQDAVARFMEQAAYPHVMVQSPASPPAAWKCTYTLSIDHSVQGTSIARFWANDLGARNGGKKVAIVREQTNALKPGQDTWEAEAKKQGMDIVAKLTIDPAATDFSATVAQLEQSGAEIVWLYMAPTPAITMINQAQARIPPYRPVWFANSISWNLDLAQQATAGALDGSYAFSPWVSVQHPRAADYRAAYQRQLNRPADDLGLASWGVSEVLDAALTRAGRDLTQAGFSGAFRTLKVTPKTWAPMDFTGGGSLGTSFTAVYKGNGNNWEMQGDFRRF
jgi:branched-chain amino acid transport system substrate-binding protein